jgi:hypothetical protein
MGKAKFTIEEVKRIATLIDLYQEEGRMTVSDSAMCEILGEAGYSVNPKWVERFRRQLEIEPLQQRNCGDELAAIHQVIKEFVLGDTAEKWQLSVSDSAMADILIERGFTVNVKFVERTRRSLGIEPLGIRGGARPGAGRPSAAGTCADSGYALVMANHYRDTYRLSDHQVPTGSLSGLSGTDVHSPKFGYHTTSFEAARERKDAKLERLAQKAAAGKNTLNQADSGKNDIDDIKNLFDDKGATLAYGKVGKKGGVHNTRAAQFYSSI